MDRWNWNIAAPLLGFCTVIALLFGFWLVPKAWATEETKPLLFDKPFLIENESKVVLEKDTNFTIASCGTFLLVSKDGETKRPEKAASDPTLKCTSAFPSSYKLPVTGTGKFVRGEWTLFSETAVAFTSDREAPATVKLVKSEFNQVMGTAGIIAAILSLWFLATSLSMAALWGFAV